MGLEQREQRRNFGGRDQLIRDAVANLEVTFADDAFQMRLVAGNVNVPHGTKARGMAGLFL